MTTQDRLPENLLRRLISNRLYVRRSMSHVAWSPDGSQLAAGGDRQVRLYSLSMGGTKKPRILRGHRSDVEHLSFSPDGALLASLSRKGTVRIWEVSSGEERCDLTGLHTEALAFAESRPAPGQWLDDVIDGRAQPRLRLARWLRFQGNVSRLKAVLASSDLADIEHLDLYPVQEPLGDAVAELLARHCRWQRLRMLRFFGTGMTAAGVRLLAEAEHLRGLETLSLFNEPIGTEGAIALVGLDVLEGLEELLIKGGGFDGEAWASALAGAEHLGSLEKLWLEAQAPSVVGALAGARQLHRLETLELRECGLTDVALGWLGEAVHLSSLTKLVISQNPLGGLRSLAAAQQLERLAELELVFCELVVEAILAARQLSGLERLDLSGTAAEGIGALLEARHLANLRLLNPSSWTGPGHGSRSSCPISTASSGGCSRPERQLAPAPSGSPVSSSFRSPSIASWFEGSMCWTKPHYWTSNPMSPSSMPSRRARLAGWIR